MFRKITNREDYFVCEDGTVHSFKRDIPIILKGGLNTAGYRSYCINGKTVTGHRLVAKHFIPNPDNKPHVNHINGNKLDNRAENLEWVTNAENIRHAWNKLGLISHRRKLSSCQVKEIREKLKTVSIRKIAKEYCVSANSIQCIREGKTYRDVS